MMADTVINLIALCLVIFGALLTVKTLVDIARPPKAGLDPKPASKEEKKVDHAD